jgi:BirA family biotin operon repressor/biotin-[acetyl-CoA-carboxylase] ligase
LKFFPEEGLRGKGFLCGQGKVSAGGQIRFHIISMETADSTNSAAMELGEGDAPHGTVVTACRQTRGRGRLGRLWVSPEGNISMSILLRPALAPAEVPLLTMSAAVGCALALREATGISVEIKWPNDLMVSGRKLGGILTETKLRGRRVLFAVVGIGINVNTGAGDFSPELWRTATSLRAETGREIPKDGLMTNILEGIGFWYGMLITGRKDRVLDEWRNLSSTLGHKVRISAGRETFEGVAEALDDEGRLVMRLCSGARKVISVGDVTMVRSGV